MYSGPLEKGVPPELVPVKIIFSPAQFVGVFEERLKLSAGACVIKNTFEKVQAVKASVTVTDHKPALSELVVALVNVVLPLNHEKCCKEEPPAIFVTAPVPVEAPKQDILLLLAILPLSGMSGIKVVLRVCVKLIDASYT